jgi:RNA polymerase II subunit A small phosphatase-like protein
MEPLLLILDIDETLVHATEHELERPADFCVAEYAVYERPHVREFLQAVAARYRLAIWTSSGRDYATRVLERILPSSVRLELFWCAERCTARFDHDTRGRQTVKSLKKVRRRGYDLARVLFIDDTPQKHVLNYGNLIEILPFEGSLADAELPRALRYLASIEHEPNMRAIEKRGWAARTTTAEGARIQAALERYLGGDDPYVALAARHRLLPILPDWTGFVGLRDDGELFWVSDDDGSVSPEVDVFARHLAMVRGAELFPELDFLRPEIAPDWVVCSLCEGTGRVELAAEAAADNIRCRCAGLGRLPPNVAALFGDSR